MERVTSYVFVLMAFLLGTPKAKTVTSSLDMSKFDTTRNYLIKRIMGPAAILSGHRIDTDPIRYAFLALLTDRGFDAARLFARMFWPENDWLHLRYDTSGPAARYLHLISAFTGRL